MKPRSLRVEKNKTSRRYWLIWIGANAAVWLVGFAVAQIYARMLFANDSFINLHLEDANYIWTRPLDSPIGSLVYGLILGAVVGFGQWTILKQRFDIKFPSWLSATMTGLGFHSLLISSYAQTLIAEPSSSQGLSGGASGLGALGILRGTIFLPSVPQWLVLRRRFGRAGWWLLASFIGLVVVTPGRSGGAASLVAWISVSLVAGAVYGFITGIALGAMKIRGQSTASNEELEIGDAVA